LIIQRLEKLGDPLKARTISERMLRYDHILINLLELLNILKALIPK